MPLLQHLGLTLLLRLNICAFILPSAISKLIKLRFLAREIVSLYFLVVASVLV